MDELKTKEEIMSDELKDENTGIVRKGKEFGLLVVDY